MTAAQPPQVEQRQASGGAYYLHLTKKYFLQYGIKFLIKKYKEKLIDQRRYIRDILPDANEKRVYRGRRFKKDILFSIVVPVYNTPVPYLQQMIESVQGQTYSLWELCLADGSDGENVKGVCKMYAGLDQRIRYQKLSENKGISENTNAALEMAKGEYICLLDHDDILHPLALTEMVGAICEQGADFVYTDEAVFQKNRLTNVVALHFKPDYAPDNLRANNYIAHFTCFHRVLLRKAGGGLRRKYDGSQDHELMLRLCSVAGNIVHLPKILYFWRSHKASVAADVQSKSYAIQAGKSGVKDFLQSRGIEVQVESSKAFPTIYRIKYPLVEAPKVSILIPNKDHMGDLSRCVDSVLAKSTYLNYEIIIIENNSSSDTIRQYYQNISKNEKIVILDYSEPQASKSIVEHQFAAKGEARFIQSFNYSAINNYGASQATGDYLLFLNNDTEVIAPDWIQEMLMFAQREDVGAVGAKLYFGDGRIQHGGLILGMAGNGVAADGHQGEAGDSTGYLGDLCFAHNVTAVTGACLMVSKNKFEKVGGFEEDLAVAYNDVDFCLKLRKKGYLNVFTPEAELFHYESTSRGQDLEGESKKRLDKETIYMKQKWKDALAKGDSYYNPNLSLVRPWKLK